MKLLSMFFSSQNNFAIKQEQKNILLYSLYLHSILIVQLIFFAITHIPFLRLLTIYTLIVFLIMDLITVVFFSFSSNFEELQSILFIIYTYAVFVFLGGFYANNGIQFLSIMVPLGTIGIYDVRKPGVRQKIIVYILAVIIPFVTSLFFHPLIQSLTLIDDKDMLYEIAERSNLLNISMFSLLSFSLLFYVSNKNRSLENRANSMIYDILPKPVADTIIARPDGDIQTQFFPEITIMVADIVNFTKLSAQETPNRVVRSLNQLFSYFDTLAEKFNLEKVRTVGDAYVLATGMHLAHTPEKIILFAKKILQVSKKIPFWNKEPCIFRIGIHTGSVFGGILGKKYFYDIWGDTIHKVDLICSEAAANTILVSEKTKVLTDSMFQYQRQEILHDETPTVAYTVL